MSALLILAGSWRMQIRRRKLSNVNFSQVQTVDNELAEFREKAFQTRLVAFFPSRCTLPDRLRTCLLTFNPQKLAVANDAHMRKKLHSFGLQFFTIFFWLIYQMS